MICLPTSTHCFVCSLDTYFLFSVWQWKCQDRYLFRHPLSNQTIWITKGIWQCGKNLSMLYWFINITAPLFWGLVTDDCKSKSHVTNSVQLAYKHFLPLIYNHFTLHTNNYNINRHTHKKKNHLSNEGNIQKASQTPFERIICNYNTKQY